MAKNNNRPYLVHNINSCVRCIVNWAIRTPNKASLPWVGREDKNLIDTADCKPDSNTIEVQWNFSKIPISTISRLLSDNAYKNDLPLWYGVKYFRGVPSLLQLRGNFYNSSGINGSTDDGCRSSGCRKPALISDDRRHGAPTSAKHLQSITNRYHRRL